MADVGPLAAARGTTLELDVDEGPHRCSPTPARTSAALARNLIDNAVRYSPDGGRVAVWVGSEPAAGGAAVLQVDDNGPGIPPADRETVFDRFVRRDHAAGQIGSGLGLAIVRQIALRQGAHVTLGGGDSPLGACGCAGGVAADREFLIFTSCSANRVFIDGAHIACHALRKAARASEAGRLGAVATTSCRQGVERSMNNLNLKPLAWGLLGAGVAVMGTAGALDLPSWLHHSTASAPVSGGGAVAAATGQQVAPTPVTPPLPSLPPGTAPNYRAIVQEFGPSVVHVSVEGTHKQTAARGDPGRRAAASIRTTRSSVSSTRHARHAARATRHMPDRAAVQGPGIGVHHRFGRPDPDQRACRQGSQGRHRQAAGSSRIHGQGAGRRQRDRHRGSSRSTPRACPWCDSASRPS